MRLAPYWGILPTHWPLEEGETHMLVRSCIKVLNIKTESYPDKDGNQRVAYKVTFSQNNDEIVGVFTARKELYDTLEKGKEYEITGEYRQTRSGNYISWSYARLGSPTTKPAI